MGKVNLGKVRGTQIYTGNAITGTSAISIVFSQSGISNACAGDLYINTHPTTNDRGNVYECTMSGDATTAEWCYQGNIRGPEVNLVDNLESTSTKDALTAYQGKRIYDMLVAAGIFSGHCIIDCDSKAYAVRMKIENVSTQLTLTVDGAEYLYTYAASGSAKETTLNISLGGSIGMIQSGGVLTDIKSSNAYIYTCEVLDNSSTTIYSKNMKLWNDINELMQCHEITGSVIENAETITIRVLHKFVNGVKKMFYPITHAKAVWYNKEKNITAYDMIRENADSVKNMVPRNHVSSFTTYGKGTNEYYGHVKLSDDTSSTDDAANGGTAATPKAVKGAYDLAKGALPASGGTMTGATAFTEKAAESGMLYMINEEVLLELLRAITGEEPALILNDGMYKKGIGRLDLNAGETIRLIITAERLSLDKSETDTHSAYFRPQNDNKCTLGTASKRFYGLWAGNSTIQTSDEREKENIIPLGVSSLVTLALDETAEQIDIHSELFDKLRPVQYNFVEGNTRTCYGLIAQDVISAMEELGIGENDLDLVHHEFHSDKETGEEKETFGLAYNNLIAMLIHEVQKLKTEAASLKTE